MLRAARLRGLARCFRFFRQKSRLRLTAVLVSGLSSTGYALLTPRSLLAAVADGAYNAHAHAEAGAAGGVATTSAKELKALLKRHGVPSEGCLDRDDLIRSFLEGKPMLGTPREAFVPAEDHPPPPAAKGSPNAARSVSSYTRLELAEMTAKELRGLMRQHGIPSDGCFEKEDFIDRIIQVD